VSGISRPVCGHTRAIAPIATTRSTTGSSWRGSSSAANSTRCSWPMCSASTTCTAGRRCGDRQRSAGAGQRSAAARSRDGVRHPKSGLQCHVRGLIRTSLHAGAAVFDARSLTGGRIGWNVVTGYLNSAAKGMGLARQPEHDTRYEIAEEYMQIISGRANTRWARSRGTAPSSQLPSHNLSGTTARISRSKRPISANPHRSARRCSIRPARPHAAANSLLRTPNACSSTGPRSR